MSAMLGDLPTWNLADLYADRADPRIEADIAAARAANDALAALEGQGRVERAGKARPSSTHDREW